MTISTPTFTVCLLWSLASLSLSFKSGINYQRGTHRSIATIQMSTITESVPTQSAKAIFTNLEASTFAHPLDKKTTARLSSLPFIESITRRLLGLAEKVAQLDNLSSSVLVGPKQMSSIYNSLSVACKILDMEEPEVYIKQNPVPNAYNLAIRGRKPFIVLHSSIVELLTEKELQAVIAHELGHLKCEHSVWITALNLIMIGASSINDILSLPLQSALYEWLRSAELSCDRAALLVSQDVNVVASVFMKLSGGPTNKVDEMNVDAYIEQAENFNVEAKKLGARIVSLGADQVMSHPVPVVRVQELVKWSKSGEYVGLLRRAQASSKL
jgi:Zn-dependent protease with chaperone function